MSDSFLSFFTIGGVIFLILLVVIKLALYLTNKRQDYNFRLHYSVMDIVLTDDYQIKKVMKVQNKLSGLMLACGILYGVGLILLY